MPSHAISQTIKGFTVSWFAVAQSDWPSFVASMDVHLNSSGGSTEFCQCSLLFPCLHGCSVLLAHSTNKSSWSRERYLKMRKDCMDYVIFTEDLSDQRETNDAAYLSSLISIEAEGFQSGWVCECQGGWAALGGTGNRTGHTHTQFCQETAGSSFVHSHSMP